MRIHLTFVTVLSPLALLAQPAFMASDTQILLPNQVVAAGPHERLWQSITVDGQGVTNVNSYTELATGLMFWNSATSRFEESKEEFSIAKSGYAIATNGQHQVILAPDISSLGLVDLLTPSGQRLVSNPRFLSFTEEATGKSVLIAEVTNCLGELTAPNVVLYPKCFDTLRAALSYTYTRSGFEQDVILYQKVSPEDYDLDPASVRLEMWSEFLTEATPQISATDSSADQTLEFEQMRLGHGVAYMLNSQTLDTIGLEKAWVEIDKRRFLVESVPYLSVKPMLDKLQASASRPSRTEVAKATFKDRRKMVAQLKPNSKSTQMASIRPGKASAESALVIDYQSLNSSQTNYIFRGDLTYFISGNVALYGSNTVFEAGSVIKETNGVILTVNTPIAWLASMYRPVVFSSKDDKSVGENITGATGTPGTSLYATTALALGVTNTATIQYLRVANAQTAVSFSGGTGHVVSHAQLVNCGTGFAATNTAFSLRNALLYNVLTNFNGTSSTGRCEHLTVDTANWLNYNSNLGITLTNSLLVGVTNIGTYTSNYVYTGTSADFQTVGASAHYLADNSPYRNIGTTNINTNLWAALKTLTTYPPILLTNDFTVDTTLSPQAQRDTDALDIGYHLSPLDYVLSGRTLTNSTLLLTNGVAIGVYGASGVCGINLKSGANLYCEGSPTRLNWIVCYNTVQEQANTNWSATSVGYSIGHSTSDSVAPNAQFRFTGWSLLGINGFHLNGTKQITTPFGFKDCQFGGGQISDNDISIGITNCVFDRVSVSIATDKYSPNAYLFNNLFHLGSVTLTPGTVTSWIIKDCLFDKTAITASGTYVSGYNGYVTNNNRLSPSQSSDKVLTNSPVYLTSFLGNYYYPNNDGMLSTLINAGSRYATNATLYHYTTTTDQVKEAGTMVDIGFHFVATDANGYPVDTDGDGNADYFEDRNGNGAFDTGETDWKTYNSPNGLAAGTGLQVFTPLK